jgi:hypothetical protein
MDQQGGLGAIEQARAIESQEKWHKAVVVSQREIEE